MFVELKQTREAAKTSLVIAREEQDRGQYRLARNVLLHMYRELKEKNIKIPLEMTNALMLLQSYLIVKSLLQREDSLKAARMLLRVVQNISRFPTRRCRLSASFIWDTQILWPS